MTTDRQRDAIAADDLTIDQLASASGVPSRTIRFYQARGLLPAPKKRGRVALYGQAHLERLQLISELQDRGLRLRAIREVLSRPEASNEMVRDWLGVSERVRHFDEDKPQMMSEEQLHALFGAPRAGITAMLVKRGAISRQGHGAHGQRQQFIVRSPALLHAAAALGNAGISLEVAIHLGEILEKRLAKAADELVAYAIDHIGRGFGRSDDPKDVAEAVEALLPQATGGEAVRLIFAREVSRAAAEHMRQGMKKVTERKGGGKD